MKWYTGVAICSISMAAMGLTGCATPSESSQLALMAQVQQARERERVERERFRLAINTALALDDQTQAGGVDTSQVVVRMKAIDTSACPNDFRAAYLTHIHAWESLADAKRKSAELDRYINSGDAIPEAVLRILLGDMFGKINELIQAKRILDERVELARIDVRTTFHRATEVAMTYGATVPASSS